MQVEPSASDLEAQMDDNAIPPPPPPQSPPPVIAAKAHCLLGNRQSGAALPNLLVRTNTATAEETFNAKMRQSRSDLENVATPATQPGRGLIRRPSSSAYGESALTFKDVTFSVKHNGEDRQILAPVSGHFEPGTLAALMGPSGSGKSTLLDILANKKTAPYGGQVHINGRPRDNLFQRIVAYVPQDDVMPAHMTVREAVLFNSELKQERPSKFSKDMARQLAERRLEVLGLEGVADSYIGDAHVRGISGGQKRRLSLARGLASCAHIIFCDEPTSGLSATDAEACVRYMAHLAQKYCVTIVVAIHQPRVEVASYFHHLMLLTSGPGRMVYNGSMSAALAYWESVGYPVPIHANPTDFYMDLITPGTRTERLAVFLEHFENFSRPEIDELVDLELHHERKNPLELLEKIRRVKMDYGYLPPVRNSKFGVPFHRQLRVVFSRQLTLCFRDKQGVIADVIAAIVKAVVVGLAYYDVGALGAYNKVAFFFMMCMTCSIDGLKLMPKIITERTIMKMETSERLYSEWAYIITFTCISVTQWLVAHSIFCVILFWMSGLPWSIFGPVFLWTSMVSLTMDGMYLMVSSIAKDSTSAIVMSVPFLMIFLLFNGFTATKNSVPSMMRWAVNISPVAFAIQQITVAALGTDDGFVHMMGYTDQFSAALWVTIAYLISFRLVQVVGLKMLNNVQR
jgi:ATP-binding cassette subfamily G (WHITE) protein 2